MPVDARPTQLHGNVVLAIEEGQARLVAGVLTEGQAAGARANGVRLYRSHFATCPHASGHRRSRNKTRRWRRT